MKTWKVKIQYQSHEFGGALCEVGISFVHEPEDDAIRIMNEAIEKYRNVIVRPIIGIHVELLP